MISELSKVRIAKTQKAFSVSFQKWTVFQEIFYVKKVPNDPRFTLDDYMTIGFRHIMKKYWFMDETGSTYYDCESLGRTRGKGVALGEAKYILNVLDGNIDTVLHLNKNELLSSISSLIQEKTNILVIINPSLITSFLDSEDFKIIGQDYIWGYFNDVPIYWSPQVDKNSVYILEKEVGSIQIKDGPSLEITEVNPSEYEKILAANDELTLDELIEMIRVSAKEIIRFDLIKPESSRIQKIIIDQTI